MSNLKIKISIIFLFFILMCFIYILLNNTVAIKNKNIENTKISESTVSAIDKIRNEEMHPLDKPILVG